MANDGWRVPPVRPSIRLVGDQAPSPLELRLADWPDRAEIPPRPWLYGTWLQRGQVTVLVADSGVGKTVLMMTMALELAVGRSVLGHHTWQCGPVLYLSLEDPRDEANRRLEAIRQRWNWSREEVATRLYLHIGRERRVSMGAIGEDGSSVVYRDRPRLIELAKAARIGLIVVDPLVASHKVSENSNEEMEEVITGWAEVADAVGCAVLLGHHTRKAASGTIDDGRGAGSVKGAVRVGLRMSPMSPDEAEQLGVPKADKWRYVRVDDGKSNMAPPAREAWWGQLDMRQIGNPTEDYPNGDSVAAMSRWSPPSLHVSLTVEECNAALDRIGAGVGGRLYAASNRGKSARWAGSVLVEMFGMTEAQAKALIDEWLRNGVLEERAYKDPLRRRDMVGVAVVNAKRPGISA